MGKLDKEVALITGAAQGIGAEIAKVYAREGATVLINDVNEKKMMDYVKQLNSEGYPAFACRFDVTRPEEIEAALAEVLPKSGSITILVNNAGISPKTNHGAKQPIQDMPYEEWKAVVDVNFNGVFNCTKAVAKSMIEGRHGKIINMSSMSAKKYTAFTAVHYIATKAAVIGLTRACSGELAQYNINVNAIAPGRIWTDMARMVSPEVNNKVMEEIPSRRFGEVTDIANAALFLASSEADYVNGTTLDVNGGWYMN